MTEEEIINKAFLEAVQANKAVLSSKKHDPEVGMHDLYKESCEMADNISYHAVKGVFPKKIFEHRSPNQTQAEATYIEKNYKQVTLPIFVDYLSTITRPFGDGNWSIAYQEDEAAYKTAGQTFQKYIEGELPIYGSLENLVKFILPTIKSIDANAFTAVRPKQIDYVLDGENIPVIDGSQMYKPTVFFFNSKNVINYSDEYYLFLSSEKSVVNYGGKQEKTGSIYELYTANAVYFIIQDGKKTDNHFTIKTFYKHDKNKIPVKQLMGIPCLKGDSILWQSPFLYATDLLDLVAMNSNWLQASVNKCVFPIVVMFGSPCEFRDSSFDNAICSDGIIINSQGEEKTCPKCSGSGLKSRLSPLGTLLLNPTTKMKDGEEKSTQDPVKFVTPDVTSLQFIDSKIESDTLKARSILHLRNKNNSTTKVASDGKTATEVNDDAKGTTAFVMPIARQIFSIFDFYLEMIALQRYNDVAAKPELSEPKTCDFKTPEEYLQDIASAMENNLPPAFIQTILMQYINSFYGDNKKVTDIFNLVRVADALFGLSQDDISLKMANGTAAKWEDILHTSILIFINDSINKDAAFLDKKQEDQILILQNLAKEKQSIIQGVAPDDITQTMLPNSGSSLKDSVGGLTSMIDIVKAVASGLYQYEAAVSLISERFGITEEQARKELGDPKIITAPAKVDTIVQLT